MLRGRLNACLPSESAVKRHKLTGVEFEDLVSRQDAMCCGDMPTSTLPGYG